MYIYGTMLQRSRLRCSSGLLRSRRRLNWHSSAGSQVLYYCQEVDDYNESSLNPIRNCNTYMSCNVANRSYSTTLSQISVNRYHHPSITTRFASTDSTPLSTSTTDTITEQLTSYLPPTPDFITNATIWGGTGLLLVNFHTHLHLPYWACISLTNICIRSAMLPIAINGAKTSVKFGKISPEVQYVLSNFTSGMKTLKIANMFSQEGSFKSQQTMRGQMEVLTKSLSTLRGLFKLNQVNLFDVFKSPLLQIPFFMYFASDLRKIIEGSDPQLAQQLVDSSFFWITDLTEPDPMYGLPIATGALLYLNVETAIGKRSLSGEASSKSNMAKILKDAFQTLAIFMPCFMAQQSSGVQLYLATSMVFTLLQSNAMRNDSVRHAIGLPPMGAKAKTMDEGEYVKDFLSKMAERQAAKAQGGFALGEGVFILGSNISIPQRGKKRKSSIVVEKQDMTVDDLDESQILKIKLPSHTLQSPLLVFPDMFKTTPVPFIPGLREPEFYNPKKSSTDYDSLKEEEQLRIMEAANRGELPKDKIEMAPKNVLRKTTANKGQSSTINTKKLKSKWNKKKKGGKRGKR